ncbi:hypothetical protein [Streptomyces montanisoli]|uniref:Uncharacterized protein n=1 Tax=Streptomyces montanisoli TaxID=2798581 RepID=A0A940MJ17_9ACTN|nr:hypothetical protein [Streptomyces montanisoli]MBP0462124.1 hypothetical protein [Streptomyces montanisoli]
MGIESDQLVFDYLSRVGDVAHQRQLPSGERMRLVSSLRSEIDRRRGTPEGDSPAAIKRLLGQLGTPEAVVGTASGKSAQAGWASADLPRQTAYEPPSPSAPSGSSAPPGPSGPHLAGMDERGSGAGPGTDWWRMQPGPGMGAGAMGPGQMRVGGFVGGVEIPEILRPPRADTGATVPMEKTPAAGAAAEAAVDEVVVEEPARRWWRRRGAVAGAGRGLTNPFLLVTAALLIVGAVLGNIWALLAGWVLAYFSRTLTRNEAKVAVFWLPGVSVAAGVVWLWGRFNDRWGKPIPDGAMGQALSDTWPVVVRVAAVASALFLVWRSRRVR